MKSTLLIVALVSLINSCVNAICFAEGPVSDKGSYFDSGIADIDGIVDPMELDDCYYNYYYRR